MTMPRALTGGQRWTEHGGIWPAHLSMIAVVSTQNMLAQAVNGQHAEDFHVIRSGGQEEDGEHGVWGE